MIDVTFTRQRSGAVAAAMFSAIAMADFIETKAHAEGALTLSDVWVPANETVGSNIVLSMTVNNDSDAADTLMRVRCPFANFSERHTVDRGEGAPAMRSIPSIPIAAKGATTLKSDAYHVMLLQTRQVLADGETLKCSIVFAKAGTIEAEVKVRK